MKIKTYFYLLIMGIVLLPVLTIIAQMVVNRIRQENNPPQVPPYEEVAPFLGGRVSPKEWESLSSNIEKRRLNEENRRLNEENRARRFDPNSPPPFPFQGAPPKPFVSMLRLVFIIVALILLFAAIMSVLIARAITKSVLALEQATKKIAEGNLDLSVEIKGSNEITSLAESFNRMRLALKEEEIRRSRFIMGITHDLKTPLALIKGYAEAIEDGVAEDPAAHLNSLKIIIAKTDQMEGMIDDLLDFVRLDSGEWRQNCAPVNLGDFLGAFAKRVTPDAEILGRRIETAINLPGDISVPMDERLITRGLENLVNNAIRYTRKNGLITIGARVEGKNALIEISDNGVGIDEKDLPHIFDVFYRGSQSRREQGMGLGLSIVKGIMDSHNWGIDVFSEKGKGARFVVTVPIGTR